MRRQVRRRERTRRHRRRVRIKTLIEEVIRELAPTLAKHETPVPKINWGFCEDVAEQLQRKLDRRGIPNLILTDDRDLHCSENDHFTDGGWTHAWVFAQGLHWDSEARMGVARWTQLPHFRRWARARDPNDEWEQLIGDVVIVPEFDLGEETRILHANARERSAALAQSEPVEPWLPMWLTGMDGYEEIEEARRQGEWRGPLG